MAAGMGSSGGDDADGDAGDGLFFDVDGEDGAGGLAGAVLPGVGAGAALGERLGDGDVGGGTGELVLGLGADGPGDGDDAGDVRGAVRVDVAGIGLGDGWLLGEDHGG